MADTVAELDAWRAETLEHWTDKRIVDGEQIDAWVWFFLHSYAEWHQIKAEFTGFSLRQKQGDWLMVVRVLQDDIPRVGFVTSSTPTRCMLKLRKMLREGALKLTTDRYA